jgi:hypothetical protein
MNFLLMYFKILYDFIILRSVFTIRVCIVFSVPCQNHDFNNLATYDQILLLFQIGLQQVNNQTCIQCFQYDLFLFFLHETRQAIF